MKTIILKGRAHPSKGKVQNTGAAKKKHKPWPGECLIMLDCETAGLDHEVYSLLSVAACSIEDPVQQLYLELKPINNNFDPEALEKNGLDFERLKHEGLPPERALRLLLKFVKKVAGKRLPVQVGRNPGFDKDFVRKYCKAFDLRWPFHYVPLDLISYYMGMMACNFEKAQTVNVDSRFWVGQPEHHALKDVLRQLKEWQRYQQFQGERFVLPNLAALHGKTDLF